YFLPLNHDYYYDDFNIDISIEFSNTDHDYIVIKETVTYTIICDDEDLIIDNKFKTGIRFDIANKDLTSYQLKALTIDNEVRNLNLLDKKQKNNILWAEYEIKLKGKKSYIIKREE